VATFACDGYRLRYVAYFFMPTIVLNRLSSFSSISGIGEAIAVASTGPIGIARGKSPPMMSSVVSVYVMSHSVSSVGWCGVVGLLRGVCVTPTACAYVL